MKISLLDKLNFFSIYSIALSLKGHKTSSSNKKKSNLQQISWSECKPEFTGMEKEELPKYRFKDLLKVMVHSLEVNNSYLSPILSFGQINLYWFRKCTLHNVLLGRDVTTRRQQRITRSYTDIWLASSLYDGINLKIDFWLNKPGFSVNAKHIVFLGQRNT